MLITGEKVTTGHGEYAGATVVHFNSIRGLNTFSDYENVIIIGREQPSSTGAEASARGIFWDDEEPIQRLGNKSGSRPFSNDTRRGYRLASGDYDSTTVQLHPDHRVQAMVEQIRESESTQAIDRLRLLRLAKAAIRRATATAMATPKLGRRSILEGRLILDRIWMMH